MIFIDTNILLYAIDPSDTLKSKKAKELLEKRNCVLSVQVLSEFYVQATRMTRSDRLSHEIASKLIKTWCRFKIIDNTLDILQKSLDIKEKYGFSYWDSAIIAASLKGNCQELISEDLQHGQKIENLIIVNPFIQ